MADQSTTGGGGFKGYIPVAAALFIGIIVGGFLFASEDVEEAIEQRVATTEAEIGEQLGAARGEFDEQLTALSQRTEEIGQQIARLDPIEEGQETLRAAGEEIGQQLQDLEARVGEQLGAQEERFAQHDQRLTAQEETGERVGALESRIQTMADQMARLVSRLQEIEQRPTAAAPARAQAPAAEAAPQERQAEQEQEAPQTETVRLGFGEVAELAGVQVFVSRVDESAGEVGLLMPGRGARTVGEDEPLDLGGGCSVRLDGFEDGVAVLSRRCEESQATTPAQSRRQTQLTMGESVTLGAHQLALERIDSEIGMAAVRVDDRRTVRIVPEWPASLERDCSVRLVEVTEDGATLAVTGDCGGEPQEESAAPQPAATQTAAAPQPETPAQGETQPAIAAARAGAQPAEAVVPPAPAEAEAAAEPEAEAASEQAAAQPETTAPPAVAPVIAPPAIIDESLGERVELRSGETATVGGHSLEIVRVDAANEYVAVRVDDRRTVRLTRIWPASLERDCVVRLVEMTDDGATLQVRGDCAG